jgi:hypothetical protein
LCWMGWALLGSHTSHPLSYNMSHHTGQSHQPPVVI